MHVPVGVIQSMVVTTAARHARVVCRAMVAMRAMAPDTTKTAFSSPSILKEGEPMEVVFVDVEKAEPRLLDLTAAAAYLGISRSAIRQLVGSG